MTDRYFVEEAEKIKDSAEILNWYRNLYHCENETTERGLMARAINDILPEYSRQKAEIDILIRKKEALRDEIAEQQAEIERLEKEVDRLSQIVMYTDSVADWKICEALNKFAERLKERCYSEALKIKVDALLEEMAGENS